MTPKQRLKITVTALQELSSLVHEIISYTEGFDLANPCYKEGIEKLNLSIKCINQARIHYSIIERDFDLKTNKTNGDNQ